MKFRITLFALVIILTLTAVQYGLAAAPTPENGATNLAGSAAIAATVTTESSTAEHEHDAAAETSTDQMAPVGEQEQNIR
ncbi:MAG: hypothetical protein HC875_07575 [Anaerolineales bacterium]|nr:hypothetical protein [Anaerolineales bacterium]